MISIIIERISKLVGYDTDHLSHIDESQFNS